MDENDFSEDQGSVCINDPEKLLRDRALVIVSNRGPFGFTNQEDDSVQVHRSGGGLVTALLGLTQKIDISWIASATNDLEKEWPGGEIQLDGSNRAVNLDMIPFTAEEYDGYYNVISNPLLWFLQHSMWDFKSNPTITRDTWHAWDHGYTVVNRKFAQAVADRILANPTHTLVMMQDYHLYLAPRMLRALLGRRRRQVNAALTHFIHIPWPGPEELRMLPPAMRRAILDGLTGSDMVGLQTRDDALNFLRSVESHLPGANVNYRRGRIWYRNRATLVRDFPISIDVTELKNLAESEDTIEMRKKFEEEFHGMQLILRVDRTEPSKNIVRGFKAFGEMLEMYPEHIGKVKFLALLVPSRLDVEEYRTYHDEFMAAAGWVNSKYGTSDWEPVRILFGDDYTRAVAALQTYDVLLVNSIADGMNLVAKEGAVVNRKNGVLVLSERTGARQQLEPGALVISPFDVLATAAAMHQALVMSEADRETRACRLKWSVEENDIRTWFCGQINEINQLGL